ncbi:unnamed protein product [Protopolystoma xenopodis]|uniref:Uncharacterized protein n=1 Tax=Protopolystoma xenopodis TaxID=117903 RepID=A0A448X9S6_9PLAT|nr:unnamed protein product [Protopolystoma xenopodis]
MRQHEDSTTRRRDSQPYWLSHSPSMRRHPMVRLEADWSIGFTESRWDHWPIMHPHRAFINSLKSNSFCLPNLDKVHQHCGFFTGPTHRLRLRLLSACSSQTLDCDIVLLCCCAIICRCISVPCLPVSLFQPNARRRMQSRLSFVGIMLVSFHVSLCFEQAPTEGKAKQ